MNITEKLIELKENGTLDMIVENAVYKEVYQNTENQMVELMKEAISGSAVSCKTYGEGIVTGIIGDTFETIIIDIAFADCNKKFSLIHIMNNKFVTFENEQITEIWNGLYSVHCEFLEKFKELEANARQIELDLKKKAEAEKKAEAKCQQLKESAIKNFDKMVQEASKTLSEVDDFYYALGWLTSHVGAVSATMPDYLSDAFKKHFGADAVHTEVDSTKRTTNGNAMQWTFGFKATLRKSENIPAFLNQYLSSTGKAIASTSFIWDLVDNYGFQFGKKQDTDKIRNTVPAKFLTSFEAGLSA